MRIITECPTDVVLDTNALSHAEQPSKATHQSSLRLIEWLRDESDVRWILDDQGKNAPDPTTSLLASEYWATLKPGGASLNVFTAYLGSGRVGFAPRPNSSVRKVIQTLVPRNKKDRAVLGAAVGSADRVLISNDYDDFPSNIRERCLGDLCVQVLDTDEAVATAPDA